MRGKVENGAASGAFSRITPAYAGKRFCGISVTDSAKDHPRLCGEKLGVSAFVCDFGGSPPPMRGKGVSKTERGKHFWITPAYAGKSLCCRVHA